MYMYRYRYVVIAEGIDVLHEDFYYTLTVKLSICTILSNCRDCTL